MHCRVCGANINEKAEICVKCGCRPFNGSEYCQECGAETTEKQEICLKCGCRLKTYKGNTDNAIEKFGDFFSTQEDSGELNLDFSSLPVYYQKEFQKIYNSNETYKGSFNIWGVLFGIFWAFYHGLWLSAIVAIIVSICTAGVGGVIYWFIYGFRGNYIFYRSYVKGKQTII